MAIATKITHPLLVSYYASNLGVSDIFAKVLLNRGLDVSVCKKLLSNPLSLIDDPFHLVNCDKAADCIIEYLSSSNAELWIFADYDVDGITSGYVMTQYLKCVTNNPVYVYYPERRESYGLSMYFCQLLAQRKKQTNRNILVITVDNGITRIDEINYLKAHAIDVVVTDHHMPQAVLPDCIICDPHICKDSSGKWLAGVGVAWKICQLIDKKLGTTFSEGLLFAVALGTVADVMPMTIENLALISAGISQMNTDNVPLSIKRFLKELDIDKVTGTSIGWKIAPKLNACGRMGDIKAAAGLFYINENQTQEINDLIFQILKYDNQRKAISKQAEQKVDKLGDSEFSIYTFDATEFAPGIMGPLAGKICEKYNKPAFVYKNNLGVLEGSARSLPGLDLQYLLEIEKENGHIISYGGHSMACGFSLQESCLSQFIAGLDRSISHLLASGKTETTDNIICADTEIVLSDLHVKLYDELNQLSYDKNSFTPPVFLIKNLQVIKTKQSGSNPNNICLTLKDKQRNIADIWAWNLNGRYESLNKPAYIDLVGEIDLDFRSKNRCTFKILELSESEKVA